MKLYRYRVEVRDGMAVFIKDPTGPYYKVIDVDKFQYLELEELKCQIVMDIEKRFSDFIEEKKRNAPKY